MKETAPIAIALLLVGCGTLPDPTAQVRMSQVQGAIEGGALVTSGVMQGTGCILSVLGKMPERLSAKLKQGDCEVEVRRSK